MGAKHALLSLVYLVGVALFFSLARAAFWQAQTLDTDREHHSTVLESSVI